MSDELILDAVLGEGGSARVHVARWRGRVVSAKVALSADPAASRELQAEAELGARLNHRNLAPVLGSGALPDGRHYVLFPRLEGEDLAARLARGPLAVAEAIEIARVIGDALGALHDAGVLHRDVKPENVFLSSDGPMLIDLGLARHVDASTMTAHRRGTHDLAAPERLFGEPATIASEVYELAALVWLMVEGSLPWPPGAGPAARRGISELRSAPALDSVLRRALSTMPERRPASIPALIDELAAAASRGPDPAEERRTEAPGAALAVGDGAPPAIGSVIGETYRLVGVLGRGGAGTVFEAEHVRLPRRFAIKLLAADRDDQEARDRFRREAEIVASLEHPRIVEVFDYDIDELARPFMVMSLLEGETLQARLRRGPMQIANVVTLISQAASAIAAAHARGVVHRDLKPSNLFLRRRDDGEIDVAVLDFGISKVLGVGDQRTMTGTWLGTPGYAAPEQIMGEASDIGPATDVFALAAIAYEAATGRRAFAAPSLEASLYKICHEEPARPGISPAIDRAICNALAKRPADRTATPERFAELLGAATRSKRRRFPLIPVAIGALVVAIAGVTGVVLAGGTDPRTETVQATPAPAPVPSPAVPAPPPAPVATGAAPEIRTQLPAPTKSKPKPNTKPRTHKAPPPPADPLRTLLER